MTFRPGTRSQLTPRTRGTTSAWLALAVVTFVPLAARGQGAPLGQPPGGTIGEDEPKKEGVAEKAPKETSPLPTLPPLPPYPGQEQKKFELITLDGYFRLRTAWMDNFHQGFHDTAQGLPFREPLTCRARPDLEGKENTVADNACGSSIGTTNMRLRLEPTIHLSENIAVHVQVDLLDNLVLGSTPDGVTLDGSGNAANVPAQALNQNQVDPQSGRNSFWNSIRVKQAWADVKTPLGTLQFGRMPNHWGLGIVANSGGYDWVHGTTCTDCDYGDNVDRFMFGSTIPGTPLRAAVAYDWAGGGPTAAQLDVWKTRYDGQPYDLDDSDDVKQYTFMVTHIDDPEDWKLAVREGRMLLNYGAYFTYRTQDYEVTGVKLGATDPEKNYVNRNASVYTPDLWGRFTFDKFTLEAELAGVFGEIHGMGDPKKLTTEAALQSWTLRQFGGVLRANYLMLNDDLELGLEVGFASGGQWENNPSGTINVHEASYTPPSDVSGSFDLTAFRFNFDYRVDLIFFREILGAVTNATYVKPSAKYNITERFGFKVQAVGSFANVPVSTPGNAIIYGVELDGDIGYSNVKEGFFAGLSYGVFFPLQALDHPGSIFGTSVGASTAQTFQGRFVLKF